MAGSVQSSNSKVYISAPSGTDVSHLKDVLTQKGLDILDFRDEFASGERWLNTMANLIRHADIVIAVLGDDANQNVMFELGFSASLNKKIVMIGHSLASYD
ncbi:TIR domain-containing protein [Rhodobacteraceae bacterium R_SAG10]|nr:TIR domain-containing protein [Rhodobacteraceae bacterium R_SAG10]